MLKNTFDIDREFVEKKFRQMVCGPETGLDNEVLKKGTADLFDKLSGEFHAVIKARAFEFIAKNVRIGVSDHDFFPDFGCWNRNDRLLRSLLDKFGNHIWQEKINRSDKWMRKHAEPCNEVWNRMNAVGVTSMWLDFDHSVPDWDRIMKLGFSGILKDVRKRHAAWKNPTPEQNAYFNGIKITYSAVLENMKRLIEAAHANGSERALYVSECLENLLTGIPHNTYEALQMIYLYFVFSEHFDYMQVRSLGNLDNLLLPYFENDLKKGTFTEEEIRMFFDYFLMQWASIDNYWGQPFYLGGTDRRGKSRINRLSYLILEEFDKLKIPTPKIQLKIAKNTPDEFLNQALRMIRNGNSSLVFIGEETIERAMTGLGMTPEDARTCNISGCYEFLPSGKHNGNGTSGGHINLLKPVELILNGGVDPKTGIKTGFPAVELSALKTFDDFYRTYLEQLRRAIDADMELMNAAEKYLGEVNPANVFSGTIVRSLETAEDGFSRGCYYNNTGLLSSGFGTAVDALMAVRDFVYDKKTVTLEQLKKILADNWKDHEKLRQQILHSKNKYGNGIEDVDRYAGALSKYFGMCVNGRPNARGGVWMASGHSARMFIILGEKTGATPDGRFDGEEMSKNLSPTMGMDVNGVTALLKTMSHMDAADLPGDFPLDVMMHPSSVAGDDGLAAWRTLIRTYMANYGLAIHFNIFDAAQLKEAQNHPEKYQGLQVRVCGWNVHFVELDKKEQDMYIRRAENIGE